MRSAMSFLAGLLVTIVCICVAAPDEAGAGAPKGGEPQSLSSNTTESDAKTNQEKAQFIGMWQVVHSGVQPAGPMYYLFTADTLNMIGVSTFDKHGTAARPSVTRMSSHRYWLDTMNTPKVMSLSSIEKAETVDYVYEFREGTLWIAPRKLLDPEPPLADAKVPRLPHLTAAELLRPETSGYLVGLEKLELKRTAIPPPAPAR